MGAPTAQVQSSQTSQPASKGAGQSASSEPGSGKGGQMSAMSGQPRMGQPNTNGNTELAPVNANFVAPIDGATPTNPYPNTIGNMTSVAGKPDNFVGNQSMGKGGGSGGSGGQTAGKGIARAGGPSNYDPNGLIENTYQPYSGPQGPGTSY